MHKLARSLGRTLVAGVLVATAQPAKAQIYYDPYGRAVPPGSYPGYVYGPARPCFRGDPLCRYYVPGFAPNHGNPTVWPFYMAPHVDDGTLNRNGRR